MLIKGIHRLVPFIVTCAAVSVGCGADKSADGTITSGGGGKMASPARISTLARDLLEGHRLGVDAQGGAVIAWMNGASQAIFVRTRRPGGRFSRALRLGSQVGRAVDTGQPDDIRADLALAVGPGGDAAVAWPRNAPPGVPGLAIARRRPAGAFDAAELSRDASDHFPAVAFDRRGRLVVAWLRAAHRGCGSVVMASVAQRARPFGAARRVSGPCAKATAPRVALGRDGSGAVAWQSLGNRRVYVATFVRGAFSRPRAVSRSPAVTLSGFATSTLALTAGGGSSVVAWREKVTASGRGRVMAATMTGDQIEPETAVSVSDQIAGPVHVAMNASDTTIVTWGERAGGRSATRRAGHTYGDPAALPCRGPAEIALDARGGALAGFWWACDAGIYAAARRLADGRWQAPLVLETDEDEDGLIRFGKSVSVGLSDAGEGLIEWKDDHGLHVAILPPG